MENQAKKSAGTGGNQKSEVRSQRSEIRGQKSEVRVCPLSYVLDRVESVDRTGFFSEPIKQENFL